MKKINVVCIDPGRGGKDAGRKENGLIEKDVTLSFAKILNQALLKASLKTFATRVKDENVSAEKRIASADKADFFISLHCNASKGNESGITVGYHIPANKHFAESMAKKLGGIVVYEELPIIRYAKVPGIIIRIGYLSNTSDAKKLKNEDFLRKLTQSITKFFGEPSNDGSK